MPKVTCGCGAAFPVSEDEANRLKGKVFQCPKCKAGKQRPAQSAKRTAVPKTQSPSSATKKSKGLWGLMSKGGDDIDEPESTEQQSAGSSASQKPAPRSTFVPKAAAVPTTPSAPPPVIPPPLATPPPFTIRRQQRRPTLKLVALSAATILVAALLLYGGAHLLSKTNAVKIPVLAKILPDPDKAAVEQWLRMNLSDPHWTEVRWWPAKDMIEIKAASIDKLKTAIADEESSIKDFEKRIDDCKMRIANERDLKEYEIGWLEQDIENWKFHIAQARKRIKERQAEIAGQMETPPIRACRIRYRSKTPFGGLMIWDKLFLIDADRRAKPNSILHSEQDILDRFFPE